MNLQVGQPVYLYKPFSSSYELEQGTVTKVGRKYFEVQSEVHSYNVVTCLIDGMFEKGHNNNPWKVFLSLQEIEDLKEHQRLCKAAHDVFDRAGCISGLSLDQLKRIMAIVEEEKKCGQ